MDKELTLRERIACTVLGKLKYDKETSVFYRCGWNDAILDIAALFLKRDPIEFMIDLLCLSKEEIEEAGIENLV